MSPTAERRAVLETYAAAARQPDPGLCCMPGAVWTPPDVHVPPAMQAMNYGCGMTVNPADLAGSAPIVYVGVGGGLEALLFAWWRRRPGGVVAVDPVPEMRAAAERNLALAAEVNPWFRRDFVQIVDGSADALPLPDASVELVAQNCLFNVFTDAELSDALAEVARVLVPGGRFSASDPIAQELLPEALRRDVTLRARCISGCRTLEANFEELRRAELAQITVRARRPYRLLLPSEFPALGRPILLESIDLVAVRTDRRATFTGRTATWTGEGSLDVGTWTLIQGQPVPISDETAAALAERAGVLLTGPTWHALPGCC